MAVPQTEEPPVLWQLVAIFPRHAGVLPPKSWAEIWGELGRGEVTTGLPLGPRSA
jgi:hypothetical protein